jgi:sulfur carrier protein ThiS
MNLYLGGYLDFYNPQPGNLLVVDLDESTPLVAVLKDLSIPVEEVQLVVINDELVDLATAMVSPQDEVKIFSAVGGG